MSKPTKLEANKDEIRLEMKDLAKDKVPVKEEAEEEEDDEELEDTGLTENQNRLLYLLSLFSHPALKLTDKEEWICRPALLVLIFEGILSEALDYDYAPASELIENHRKYFNISQEGKSDIDFLREEEMVNALKLSSKSYEPVTCYQINEKGLELIKKLGKQDKRAIEQIAYAPGTKNIVQIEWDGKDYWLIDKISGYRKQSNFTEIETVSYVSSAYIPQYLRRRGRPTLSNAHRAHECGISASNIRETLDEIITLNSVSIIVAEFIPFGVNQIVQLNANLGSADRVQGGYLTADANESDNSKNTCVSVSSGLTSISILDYDFFSHLNFEADIHYPEAPGIVQIETFGCSIHASGCCLYGMQVEAILDRIKDNISLDHLSRLLVDVHMDSSKIVYSVLSTYQRQILELLYNQDAASRNKVNLIIANEVTPHLTAEEYMDKGEYENELKQVIGDTRAAYDITEQDTLIFGSCGFLIAGPNSRHYEPLLCNLIELEAINLFTQNFFGRAFVLLDSIKLLRKSIDQCERNPNQLKDTQNTILKLSKETIQMNEILSYLEESIETMVIMPEPTEQAGRSLYERLDLRNTYQNLENRIKDLNKIIHSIQSEFVLLREMIQMAHDHKTSVQNESVQEYLRRLCMLEKEQQTLRNAVRMIQWIASSAIAYATLDRITGNYWTVTDSTWLKPFYTSVIHGSAGVYFLLNLLFGLFLAYIFYFVVKMMGYREEGTVTVRIQKKEPINLRNLEIWLKNKTTNEELYEQIGERQIATIQWKESNSREWGGVSPIITMEYDKENAFMLQLTINYKRRQANQNLAFNSDELATHLMKELEQAKIFL